MGHSFQKCKLIDGDRTQTGGCLGSGEGPSGELTDEQEEHRGDDEYFHYLDGGDGSMNVYTCQNLPNCHFNYLFEYVTLNMSRLSCVIDFPPLLKIATALDELGTGERASVPPQEPGEAGRSPELSAGNGGDNRRCHRDSVCFQKEGRGSSCHRPPSRSRNGDKTCQLASSWGP